LHRPSVGRALLQEYEVAALEERIAVAVSPEVDEFPFCRERKQLGGKKARLMPMEKEGQPGHGGEKRTRALPGTGEKKGEAKRRGSCAHRIEGLA